MRRLRPITEEVSTDAHPVRAAPVRPRTQPARPAPSPARAAASTSCTLPAGHYILAGHQPAVDAVVGEINANLRHLCAGRAPVADDQLRVLYRPIPAPTDGEAA